MGLWSSFLTSLGIIKRKVNILLVGLDNAGKSTIINGLKVSAVPQTEVVPTVGFNVETFSTQHRLTFTVFDMSGQGKYRDLWEYYYPDVEAIVFVIDASDKIRACVARDELETMLQNKVLRDRKIPILFFANKMDVEGGMSPSECSGALGLEEIKDRNWTICATNGITGQGVGVGLDWLAEELKY
ncbi:ARF/SAR superfamily [Rhizoclosmatium globosum]|uniref:ARF/SAR superfamily n=1 Tax=Rhizoclosmatium globosum TaxID=329046 RepID=A0A1Y2C8M4_9FUNG|nr:ARF/SAR superfamily [Rhizoclosmatium globosum]|eukprot:ORY43372.1 ARF/SAR superfamily [Rhizoclosmatium globosum]